MASKLVKKFVTACTLTFKAFDHEVTLSEGKSTLWNFTTVSKRNQKNYAVYCAPDLKVAKNLIKIALKKVPSDHRLVVVTKGFGDEDLDTANEEGYCLVSIETLNQFGAEMLEIREKEIKQESSEAPAAPVGIPEVK